ncbi:molybdopterin oxidoreductase family protein [Hahella sp. CR1]|uniref:molybdopterin oxidoreductase family protein n=1 Tax=Hahella sp. CR1 TaxID=2992807 RepID=UPI002442738E|nr:molybdopterin oxidoreductase family protein [Hahella sp. CR1]MDG9666842.1 molybdopterin oxidoreductase family protein [Hahella sp. CR1]
MTVNTGAEQESRRLHFRNCTLCEAMCGLRIETHGDEVVSIKGDAEDPFSEGFICPKAVALQDLQNDPDRLRQPLRRTADGWEEISWGEALDYTAQRLIQVREEHGRNALGVYLGNPNVHDHGNTLFILPFLRALATRKRFSATSLDQLPHMLANLTMFGNQGLFPVPDIDRCDLFVCIGGNPLASNGSLMSAGGVERRLKAIRERGGKVVTIDPRKAETAKVADEHIFIRPGTDVLLLLAIINVLFDEDLVNLGHLADITEDVELLRLAGEAYPAERVAEATGVAADDIRKLARELAQTRQAVLYGRMGVSVQRYGGLCVWLIYCINILTGHLDRRGGLMFTQPAIDLPAIGAMSGHKGHFGRYRSSVRGLPEFGGELPAATLAEEILTEGPEQIKAMVVVAGNPVLSSPNGGRLDAAFESLEFMVSIDMYVTETSRHADIILPPAGPLQRSHIDIVFAALAVRNTVKYSPPLFPKEDNELHDWEIFLELSRRLSSRDLRSSIEAEFKYKLLKRLGPDGLADIYLQLGPYGRDLPASERWSGYLERALQALHPGHPLRQLWKQGPLSDENRDLPKGLSIKTLLQHPHGVDLGPLRPCLPQRLFTKDKRINLAPKIYLSDLSRVKALLNESGDDALLLIGRRHVRSNNSWLHNSHRLVKGKNRCTLLMHPRDASRYGVRDGEDAEVRSRVGVVVLPVEVTDDIMPGVVSIPHGWGHKRSGVNWCTASAHGGVSVNDLTDELWVDPLSGNAALNGVPVTVKSATGRKGKSRSAGAQKQGGSVAV